MFKIMGNKKSRENRLEKGNIKNITYNINIAGYYKVGKSTLLKKLPNDDIENSSNRTYTLTYQYDNTEINPKFIVTENSDVIDDFNNCKNHEYYKQHLEQYNMIILIYDKTNKESFNYAKKYFDLLENLSRNYICQKYPLNQLLNMKKKKIFCISNKSDLVDEEKEQRMIDDIFKKDNIRIESKYIPKSEGMIMTANQEFDSEYMDLSLRNFDTFDEFMDIFVDLISRDKKFL